MGKKSRLKREKRENPSFRITIGTAMHEGDAEGDIALQTKHQSRLIKAALLYADKVTLCGPMVSTILASARMASFSDTQKIELLRLIAPTMSETPVAFEDLEKVQQLSKGIEALMAPTARARAMRAALSSKERAELEKFSGELREMMSQIAQSIEGLSETARRQSKEWGTDQLQDLITKGKVDLINLGPSLSDVDIVAGAVQSAAHLQQLIATGRTSGDPLKSNEENYKNKVFSDLMIQLERVINSHTDYALFDQFTANLVRLGLEEGRFAISSLQKERATHVGLAASLLERLPLFDEATLAELLDIKAELQKPLLRFQHAMMKYSSEMSLASWDPEFQLEAERVFRREIEPIVLTLEEDMRSNNYLLEIGRRLPEKPFAISGTSALGVAIANSKFLGETWFSVASVGASAAVLAADAWKQYATEKRKIESNQLFFYIKAGQKLSHK